MLSYVAYDCVANDMCFLVVVCFGFVVVVLLLFFILTIQRIWPSI